MTNPGDIYDSLTTMLQAARDALKAMNLGVSAWVPMSNDTRLVFEKDGSSWELVVSYPNNQRHNVCHAPVHLRLEAAKHLPELKKALKKAYEDRTNEVNQAISHIKDFLIEMKAEGYVRG